MGYFHQDKNYKILSDTDKKAAYWHSFQKSITNYLDDLFDELLRRNDDECVCRTETLVRIVPFQACRCGRSVRDHIWVTDNRNNVAPRLSRAWFFFLNWDYFSKLILPVGEQMTRSLFRIRGGFSISLKRYRKTSFWNLFLKKQIAVLCPHFSLPGEE